MKQKIVNSQKRSGFHFPDAIRFQKRIFFKAYFVLLVGIAATLLMSSCIKSDGYLKNPIPFKAHFVAINESLNSPENPIQKDRAVGPGEGTPIGKANLDATLTYDLSGPSPLKVTGDVTIKTANGDKIFMTQDSYSPDPDAEGNFKVIGSLTITGGTGKYSRAKGTLKIEVLGNFASAERDVSMEGMFSY